MTTVSWFTRSATRIPAANSEQFRSKQGRKHTNGIEPRPVALSEKSYKRGGYEHEARPGGLRIEGKVLRGSHCQRLDYPA